MSLATRLRYAGKVRWAVSAFAVSAVLVAQITFAQPTAPFAATIPAAVGDLLTVRLNSPAPNASSAFPKVSARSRNALPLAVADVGEVDALDQPRLERTFTLINDGSTPLAVGDLRPSCHCTTAAIDGASLLAPGGTLHVRVTVNLSGLGPGPLFKSVSVYTADASPSASPAAILEINGTLRPSITLAPAVLDFGAVPAGSARSLNVTAIWDARLADPPPLRGSGAFTVTAQPVHDEAPAALGGKKAQRTRTRVYQITVSAGAPLGPLDATIAFAPPLSGTPDAAGTAQAAVFVSGHVEGEAESLPASVAFGLVRFGDAAERDAVLSPRQAGALDGAAVESASPWISAHLDAAAPVFSDGRQLPGVQVLHIVLSPQAPSGVLHTILKVTLAGRQRLMIPVSASVVSERGG